MKKLLCVLLAIAFLFSLAACGGSETPPEDVTEGTTAAPTVDMIIKQAQLQYPSSNDLFKYNVYDTYVAISEYIGPASKEKLTVPGTLEDLPVYVVERGTFKTGCKVKSIVFEEGIHDIKCELNTVLPLTSVTLPSTVETVKDIFKNCYKLETVIIPEGVEMLLLNTFEHCKALKTIALPSTLKVIGSNAFAFCTSLESVTIAKGLTKINDRAFVGCKAIKTLKLPGTLEYIGADAFLDSGLVSLEIPESVKSIGSGLFSGCNKITTVKVHNADMEIEPVSGYSVAILFSNCNPNLVVHGKPASTIAKQCAQEKISFKVMQ